MLWTWFVLVFILLWVIVDWWYRVEAYEKIPGPKGIYLLGNGFDFLVDGVKLFNVFRRLSNEYKDIYKIKLGFLKGVCCINPEIVETVISGSRNIQKGYLYFLLEPWLKEGLLLSDGEKWHHRRKILTPTFHFNILQNFMMVFEDRSKKLVENLSQYKNGVNINITAHITDCTLNAICETAMGVKLDNEATKIANNYKNSIYSLGELLAYRGQRFWLHPRFLYNMSPCGRRAKMFLETIGSFRDTVLYKRSLAEYRGLSKKLNFEDDNENMVYKKNSLAMLDMLLEAEKQGAIDREGIKEEVDTFMFEGHDTVATCLQFLFMLLANNPQAQEKVFQECEEIFGNADSVLTMEHVNRLKYLECCIKEALRLYPPVYFIIRKIDQDLSIGKYMLPAGTQCGIIVYDMHRRADQFVEPLEFRPERFMVEPTWHPYAYIPFSAGPRNCIGQRFAMIEMKLLVSTVIRRFRLLPVTTPKDLVFYVDLILRTKDPIYIQLESRY